MSRDLKNKIYAENASTPEPLKSVIIALAEFQNGLVIERACPFCDTIIRVEGHNTGLPRPTAWSTKCDCGRCNETFRGV